MAWIVVVWMGDENRQGFEEFIKSSRTHGLDQLWLGWGMKIVKGLRNLLHLPGLMAWIFVVRMGDKSHLSKCQCKQMVH